MLMRSTQNRGGENLGSGNYEISYNSLVLEYNQQRYIKFDDSIGRYNYQSGAETPFIRTIYIENPSIDEIKVNSIVFLDRTRRSSI